MKTDNMVKSLDGFGIRAAAYKRPPTGRDVFALSIQPTHREGTVTVNQGKAEVEVFGDRKRRQAAVTVREKGRVVTRSVEGSVSQHAEPQTEQLEALLRDRFPVVVPPGTKWIYSDVKHSKRPNPYTYNTDRVWEFSGKLTARVARSTVNHFLIGMDETHHFVAPLPAKATSVREAHRLLRPKRLRRGTKRHGEWFFEPCLASTRRMLEKAFVAAKPWRIPLGRLRLTGTTHEVSSHVTVRRHGKRTVYAKGYVIDRREGHHKALFLPEWHKVIRNREATVRANPGSVFRSRMSWD